MAARSSYVEVENLLDQIRFQISPVYQNKDDEKDVDKYSRLNPLALQYDFSLEVEVKKVFDQLDENKSQLNSETEVESENPPSQVCSDCPPIPKRGFEKEVNENDSGVSSGGENQSEVLGATTSKISTPLQPRQTSNTAYTKTVSSRSQSVLDIFDVSRDDPFSAAHLNSIDEKEILAQVFPPSTNSSNGSDDLPPKPKSRARDQSNVVSSLQSVLDARQIESQKQKSQNFNKSALAALNSLPIIASDNSRPSTPLPYVMTSIFQVGSEKFGERLVQMGYDESIVLKAIQLFGNDEHKCIDFITAYMDLLKSGSKPSEIVTALTVCEYSKTEAENFLRKSKRYLEMGFSHQAVRNALIRYPNEPAYVLESLMAHSK